MADPIVKSIPLSQIVPSKHQARKAFDEESLKGLSVSMAQEGLIQPVTVRPVGEFFELISGERRVRAAKLIGWDAIDARVIQTSSEAEAAAKGLVENIQREDLNAIEEAEGFQELHQLDAKYWTQEKIADTVGKERTYVSRSLNLLSLPDAVKEDVRRRTLERGHAIEFIRINNANSQVGMANKAVKGQWSVKQLREAIDNMSGNKKATGKHAAKKLPDVQWRGEEIIINRHFRPVEESLAEFMAWLSGTLEPMVTQMPGLKDSPKSEKAMLEGIEARAAKANAAAQVKADEALSKMSPAQLEHLKKEFKKSQQPDTAAQAELEAMQKKIEADNDPDNAAAYFAKHLK